MAHRDDARRRTWRVAAVGLGAAAVLVLAAAGTMGGPGAHAQVPTPMIPSTEGAPLGQGTGPLNPAGATEPGASTDPMDVSSTNPSGPLPAPAGGAADPTPASGQ